MTNAHGYANYRREENSMDPNRDFPYLQDPTRCMQTQTARAVNEPWPLESYGYPLGSCAPTFSWNLCDLSFDSSAGCYQY